MNLKRLTLLSWAVLFVLFVIASAFVGSCLAGAMKE